MPHPFVIASEAQQSGASVRGALDCLVAPLLAMTMVGLLAGCKNEQAPQPAPSETPSAAPTVAANGNDIIECAIHGGQWFLRECEVEKTRDETGALVLVVHHLDGGFRRFKVVTDGRGLETADGFEQAQTAVVDGRLDVRVGDDRYRFPATIKPHAKPA